MSSRRMFGLVLLVVAFLVAAYVFGRPVLKENAGRIQPTSEDSTAVRVFQSPLSVPESMPDGNSPVPAPTADKVVVTAFQFQKPILQGDTVIKGSGPPNVPIQILDITFLGQFVAAGRTDADGKFSLAVPSLEKGHRLGIALGNLGGTGLREEDFRDEGFQGEEAQLVPQVGFFYDTALVRE